MLRLYTFCNFYLSSIQQGIQTSHVVSEMFVKYNKTTHVAHPSHLLWDWADDYKTIVALNGGNCQTLSMFADMFGEQHDYPWAAFREDAASLNGSLTSVGIVLPEKVYMTAIGIRSGLITEQIVCESTYETPSIEVHGVTVAVGMLTEFDRELAIKLSRCVLAS